MPSTYLNSQIRNALEINIDLIIDQAIKEQLLKWRSKNNYLPIAREIERIVDIDSHGEKSFGMYWRSDSRDVFGKKYEDYITNTSSDIEEIIEDFRYEVVGIDKVKLENLLQSILRFCYNNARSLDVQDTFSKVIEDTLYNGYYDTLNYYVKQNLKAFITLVKEELITPEFSSFKQEFIVAQNELARSYKEESLVTLNQYQAHIMLTIDIVMSSMLSQMQVKHFNDFDVFPGGEELRLDKVDVDHSEIRRIVLNFHKLFVPNNNLQQLVYSSKNPNRVASTKDKLPEYIKGLISKGEFLTRDNQRKSDIKKFAAEYSKLQRYTAGNCNELERIIQRDFNQTTKEDKKIFLNYWLECLQEINERILSLVNTGDSVHSCIICLTQDIILNLNEKIDYEQSFYNISSQRKIALDALQINAFKESISLLERELKDICLSISFEFGATLEEQLEQIQPLKALFKTALKRFGSDLIESSLDPEIRKDIFKTRRLLLNKVEEFETEIIASRIKLHQLEKEKILELAYQRKDVSEYFDYLSKRCMSYQELFNKKLETYYKQLSKKLELDLPKVRNNMLVYMVLFCVDSNPEQGEYSERTFIPVHIGENDEAEIHLPVIEEYERKAWQNIPDELLLPIEDYRKRYGRGVQEVLSDLKSEDSKFLDLLDKKRQDYTKKTSLDIDSSELDVKAKKNAAFEFFKEIAFHSEREFTSRLRDPAVVDNIVTNLENAIHTHRKDTGVKDFSTPPLKHKVYSVTILAYSTNSVCPHCTRALITQLNDIDPNTSFLGQLYQRISNSSLLTTTGKEMENDIDLKRSTIVISGKVYSSDEQAKLRTKFPKLDFTSRLPISQGGVLDIQRIPKNSYVEMIQSSADPFVRREQIKGDSSSSGSNLDARSRNETATEASSKSYVLSRNVEYKGHQI